MLFLLLALLEPRRLLLFFINTYFFRFIMNGHNSCHLVKIKTKYQKSFNKWRGGWWWRRIVNTFLSPPSSKTLNSMLEKSKLKIHGLPRINVRFIHIFSGFSCQNSHGTKGIAKNQILCVHVAIAIYRD